MVVVRRALIVLIMFCIASVGGTARQTPAAKSAATPAAKPAVPAAKPVPGPAAKVATPAVIPVATLPTLSDRFPGLDFRNIGPFRGGRVTAVTGVRGNPLLYYFGATGGGVWKTTDGGLTWRNISDAFMKTGSVGAVAVAGSDPNVIYVGMGEAPIRGNVSHGDGVYKSTDAGTTWTHVGLRDTRQISRVRIHPQNPDIAFVAAQGHAWGPNPDRGVFRTLDGGKSWSKVLFVDDKTGASDLVMDATNPRILYAAFWQAYRAPWSMESGGPGGGLYRTIDGGDTWKKLTEGLPEGIVGKTTVTVSPKNPSRVWAMVEAEGDKGGLYRSDDGGDKWMNVNNGHAIRQRAWYYYRVFADPTDADVVYTTNIHFHRSIDGGKTFSSIRVRHGDTHDLWIDPDDPERMILGDDGGAEISNNSGRSWTAEDNQPTAQIYRVITDDRFPYWVYGAQQDNTTVAIPSAVRGGGIDVTDWHEVGGGESAWIALDPRNRDIVYAGSYGGWITRYDHATKDQRMITAWPQVIDGQAPKDLRYRFQWNAPVITSKHEPGVVYHAAQMLLRSRDEGHSWEEASPDLTRNDKTKQGYSGGPITHEVTGVEVYGTIFALTESPHEAGVIWAGTDDGLVHITKDNARTWQNVTPKGMPDWIRINAIDVSPHDKASAYVAATMYQFGDLKPYLFKTNDYGQTWTKIVAGIPDTVFTRVVREDPGRRGLLYAGTETGLYVSWDDGASWEAFQRNLPTVPITDMVVKHEDLVVATQGRAFWILDDLTPLRQWKPDIAKADVHLFTPRPAIRFENGESSQPGLGKNRPNGVVVNLWLKDKPKKDETITVAFLDGARVLRSFTTKLPEKDPDEAFEPGDEGPGNTEKAIELKAGVNRLMWDMRDDVPSLIQPNYVFGDYPPQGVRVTPGHYAVRVTAMGKTLDAPIEIVPNPAGTASGEDLTAQYTFLTTVRRDVETIHDTLRQIKDVKDQVTRYAKRAAAAGKGDALKAQADAIVKAFAPIEAELYNPKLQTSQDSLNYLPKLDFQFTALAGMADTSDVRPTAASHARYKELRAQLDAILVRVKAAMDTHVDAFNKAVKDLAMPAVIVGPGRRQP
jgi:photosystem II stability/assembly factor-like uncharacterized protein